jgi:cell division protein ZapA (FtsZ GTPase activity inhibitor)
MQKLNSELAGDKNLHLVANWEHKTDKLIQNRIVKTRLEEMRHRYAGNLVERKAKLAALLAHEDLQYEQEFNSKLETPE